jgi:hypothetical protein
MALTLNPGNEPEFYIPHEQLPDTRLEDIKLSLDSEYLAITGSNALSYIYRRKPDGSGFYKLDWSCQHSQPVKSVINFVGFGENGINRKNIICPVGGSCINQYELNADDTIELRSTLDISKNGIDCIKWLICFTSPNYETHKCHIIIFIIGMYPDASLKGSREYEANIHFDLICSKNLLGYVKMNEGSLINKKESATLTKEIYVNRHKSQIFTHNYIYWWRHDFQDWHTQLFYGHPNYNHELYAFSNDKDGNIHTIKYTTEGIYDKKGSCIKFDGGHISKIKSICNDYVIIAESIGKTVLYSRDSQNLNTTHIKTYNDSDTVSMINLFTLNGSYNCSYIAVHEYDRKTKARRLGFIQYILSKEEKKKFQAVRISDMLTSLITTQNIILPPELISIVTGYL